MKKLLTFLTLFTLFFGVGWAETVTDEITYSLVGVTGTSYANWEGKISNSSAVYAGNSAGGNNSIQLRSKDSNSGIVTTSSGGKAKSIQITWNSNTQAGRKVTIYGKNSAYTAASDLYNTSNQGTQIGEIAYDNENILTLSGNYTHIGIRSASGALYIDKITITWETDGGGTPDPTTYSITGTGAVTGGNVTATATSNITAGTSVTITAAPSTGYELSNLTVDNTDVTNNVNSSYEYTFTMPEHDVAVSATFTEQQASTDQYELVKDVTKLAAGDKIIIASTDTDGSGKAMSTTQNSNNRGATDVSISNSIITPGSSVQIITLEKDGDNWLFNVGMATLWPLQVATI